MKSKHLIFFAVTIFVVGVVYLAISQTIMLRKAHSTFENYYAFRDCKNLLKKTDTYGLCQLSSGQTIKLVEFRGKWYLDGDLPVCIQNICL